LAQLRLHPSAFGVNKYRYFLPAMHDWFGLLLLIACGLMIWELSLSNLFGLDLSGNLSFVVIVILISRIPYYLSDRLAGKLVISSIDLHLSIYGFLYQPLAFINS